jgi:hypothetical protein
MLSVALPVSLVGSVVDTVDVLFGIMLIFVIIGTKDRRDEVSFSNNSDEFGDEIEDDREDDDGIADVPTLVAGNILASE